MGEAFGNPWQVPWLQDRAALFVVGYLAIQLHVHFVNALVWEIGTVPIWIAGIAAGGDTRLAIWAAAVLVSYGGVIAAHPLPGRRSPFSSDSQIYAEHLLERFRLFFLIALGETVLTIGNAFAGEPVSAARLLVLAGIVAIAVGDELAIATPGAASTAALVFGGPLIFLLAQMAFMRRATGHTPQSRAVACITLVGLSLATLPFSLLAAVIADSAVLVAVAVDDTRAESHVSAL